MLCVPITEKHYANFLNAIIDSRVLADIIELRLDYLSDEARAQAFAALPTLATRLSKPLLFTFRPREQGGQRDLTLHDRRTFWRSLPPEISNLIAFADFEFDLVESFAKEAPPLPWEKVICSWHDFAETPNNLLARYELMASTPAAIVKIVTQANRISDCLHLFELLEHAQSKKTVIVLGMGMPGLMTRVLALSRSIM